LWHAYLLHTTCTKTTSYHVVDVFTALMITVFWDMPPWRLVICFWRFRETSCLHLSTFTAFQGQMQLHIWRLRVLHSTLRSILIMKANKTHYFSNLFDKALYMFQTCPLSIIRSISTLYTHNTYLSC